MTSAFILIFSVLILGGILAALGDRLGSKVGKARLRLFNLRPKQTAVVVTVLTGTMIAASTLGLLFGLSESLRQGVFELDSILRKRREELEAVQAEKDAIEEELAQAEGDRLTAQENLRDTEQKFETAQAQLDRFREQATVLQADIDVLADEQSTLRQQRDELQTQSETLAAQLLDQNAVIEARSIQINALERQQTELQSEIDSRDGRIAELDQAIAQRDQVLSDLESQISSLSEQVEILSEQIDILEALYINFRSGNIVLTTGQVLAFGVVRVIDPEAAPQAIDQLLREANRNAILATNGGTPDFETRLVQITNAQVQQVLGQIADGQDYVVRLLSAGNYIQGESQVQVFADVTANEQIFRKGDVIATLSLEELSVQNPTAARRPVDFLLEAAQFRARRAGILGDIQVKDGSISHLLDFVEALNNASEPITEIRAIAINDGFTAGPLQLEMLGLSNGRIVIRL